MPDPFLPLFQEPVATGSRIEVTADGAQFYDGPRVEPVAKTAGEQDHSDPWAYADEDADAPEDVG